MPTTPEQIDLWRSAPTENQSLEFKEAKIQFDNKALFKYWAPRCFKWVKRI
ncbi:MAG: hypothetical protein NTW14_02595 [bacterium]|nr:hypothetical protein [bacterium]